MLKLKYYLLFIFLISGVSKGYAQWEQIFEKDDNTWTFTDIHFFDQDTGVVVIGTNSLHQYPLSGYILSTENGGQTWDTSSLYQDTSFLKMDFLSRNVGFIVASASPSNDLYLYKTTDGGNNWSLHSFIMAASILECSLNFYDENVGVFSIQGYSSITYDGGQTWNEILTSTQGSSQYALIKDSIYAGTFGAVLYYSLDTCQSYFADTVSWGGSSYGIEFDGDKFYVPVLGNQGFLYDYPYFNFGVIAQYDIDNGLMSTHHFPYQRPRTLERTENGFLYAGTFDTEGYDKRFLKSIDGGQTWYSQQVNEYQLPPSTRIKNMHCVNDTVCFATSDPVIYKTINGGGALIEQVGFAYSSVEENASLQNTLVIYPNPAQNILNITTDEKIEQVQVVNLSGKILLTVADGNTSVDVGHLKSGVYLVKIQTDKNSCIRKFVKQ